MRKSANKFERDKNNNQGDLVGIYGADTFFIYRPGKRRGFGESIYYDEICFPCKVDFWDVYGGEVILDTGCMIFSSVDNLWTKEYIG